jgi:hypothetical protein
MIFSGCRTVFACGDQQAKSSSVAIREGKNFNLDRWYRFAFSRIDNAGGQIASIAS